MRDNVTYSDVLEPSRPIPTDTRVLDKLDKIAEDLSDLKTDCARIDERLKAIEKKKKEPAISLKEKIIFAILIVGLLTGANLSELASLVGLGG